MNIELQNFGKLTLIRWKVRKNKGDVMEIKRILDPDGTRRKGGKLIIGGFPTQGTISTISAGYIVENLDMELTGVVKSDEIPPISFIKAGKPLSPSMYYMKGGLTVFVSYFTPSEDFTRKFASSLLDWAVKEEYDTIISLESVASKNLELEREVVTHGASSTDEGLKKIEEAGIEIIQEGLISGVSGELLAEASLRGVNVITLIVESNPLFPDVRAAIKLIESTNSLIPEEYRIDTENLEESAKEIEKNIKDTLEHTKKMIDNRTANLPEPQMFG